MVNMCTRLCRYLYAIFLICISTMTHSLEVTDLETGHGAFAFPTICSHSNLSYCVNANDGEVAACALYQPTLDTTKSFVFQGVQTISNGTKRCSWKGKNPVNNTDVYASAQLIYKLGVCPEKDAPPPEIIKFGRQGRWFPQELTSNRCYKTCEYSNGQSFQYKHLLFTNGVITEFTENSNSRLKSTQKFCYMQPEPIRDSTGEITYESNCNDATFKQLCDFINWFRNDSEMPDAPEVKTEQINLAYIKTDHVHITSDANNLCFDPYVFDFYLPFSQQRSTQEIKFDSMCSKINEYGNLWRALYLLAACYIIFGGRK